MTEEKVTRHDDKNGWTVRLECGKTVVIRGDSYTGYSPKEHPIDCDVPHRDKVVEAIATYATTIDFLPEEE